jgi:uncharacterized membrane protein
MSRIAAITVNRPREEVERRWSSSQYRPEYVESADAAVSFADAPGDRGTEIRVHLEHSRRAGKVRAKVLDDLRRFKQHVETGVVARSEGTPEGEHAERKLKQRPAQPLSEAELEKAGV